ncbi:MAG: hypothetical protein H0W86_00225 [Armatimonadetes bacterium]|nr:hypothetical protein [Armatimonadota bacterium]
MNSKWKMAIGIGAALAAPVAIVAQEDMGQHTMPAKIEAPKGPAALLPLPDRLPGWMKSPRYSEVFYKRGSYNFDIYNVDPMARDFNAVAVGHSMAYEDLVTGKAATLDTRTFGQINWVLNHPPKLMPGEKFLSPSFARHYGALEKVFDWTHVLHAQTIDVLASMDLTQEQKDLEIQAIWRYYKEKAPFTVTGLPLNMDYLDSQAYSGAFRRKYPKVNGLFWGYHWLQGAVYDMLWKSRSLADMRTQYEVLGKRYHEVELYRTDRDFMPMFSETSPEFARRFPQLANAFDNLHMLHDMVNDILVSDWMSPRQKDEQIKRAIWIVVDDPHKGEKPGDFKPGDYLHDHRFMEGQPGLGMMKMSTPQLMYMPGMGWMDMSSCAHCSMPIDFDPKSGAGATVSAEGWTMNVRCVLCARDMAAQVAGEAIIRANTEDPLRPLILISNEEGNLKSNIKDVVFLEVPAGHAGCSSWSRAFTSVAAFDAYVKAQEDDEDLQNAKPLTLAEWSRLGGDEPDTYEKKQGPVDNPYKQGGDGGAGGQASGAMAISAAEKPSCCSGGRN